VVVNTSLVSKLTRGLDFKRESNSMNASRETILNRIKRLYTELFLSSLHDRIDSYHASSDTDQHHKISDSLNRLIEKTSKQASQTPAVKVDKDTASAPTAGRVGSPKTNKLKDHQTSLVSMTLNGLSVYFKKNKTQEHDPEMSDKLQRCVWDHVHSAHRSARNGDEGTAKLHAGIASNAMKTLSHYLPEDQYNNFCTEVQSQLETGSGSDQKTD